MDIPKVLKAQIVAYKEKLIHDLDGVEAGDKIEDFGKEELLVLMQVYWAIKDKDIRDKVATLIDEFDDWRLNYPL